MENYPKTQGHTSFPRGQQTGDQIERSLKLSVQFKKNKKDLGQN